VGMMSSFITRIAPGPRPVRAGEWTSAELDPAGYRHLMSSWPTGVSVVTSSDGDDPKGCTVNSLTSLSLDPLLLLVALHSHSSTLDAIRSSGRFCINVLAAGQEDLSRRFACREPDVDKFAGVEHSVVDGLPRLGGSLACISCEAEQVLAGGDHEIVVARPIAGRMTEGAAPLLFVRRGYSAAA
jgi:flavin reductase (DIM6/NTAB) family NADH-FMN oxidoreductase RutF